MCNIWRALESNCVIQQGRLALASPRNSHRGSHCAALVRRRWPQDERGHLMRLKWLPHVGGVCSAVGDHGTWIIVNTNMAGKPNWWLCVHPWDSNDFEERGNFPNREAAQAHAQDREDGVPIQVQGSAK
jgi:hypothetical protein